MSVGYSEEHIKTLEWREHIRLRPGMYIGKLGDGSSQDDGVYVLLKGKIKEWIVSSEVNAKHKNGIKMQCYAPLSDAGSAVL